MSAETFLELDVQSSSPARLRLLLIQKAVGLCEGVQQQWESGDFNASTQWTIRIRDILIELLDGVTDENNPAAQSVCDLYVYLVQLLDQSTGSHDIDGLRSLQEVLLIELETWTMFVRSETAQTTTPSGFESSAVTLDHLTVDQPMSLDLQM